MADINNAQIGSQVTLQFWNTALSPDAYADLGKIRAINGYGVDLPEVNSTTLDSVEEDFIPGLPMGKELSIPLTLSATSLANLEQIHNSPIRNIDLKLIFPSPTGATRYFTVTPRGFEIGSITPQGLIEVTFNARRSGPATSVNPH